MRKTVVKIHGPVSSMKSPLAEKIRKRCERNGLSCEVIDHRYFSFDEGYEDKIAEEIAESEADVTVIVIGTGTKDRKVSIEIEPAIYGMMQFFKLLRG